MRSVVSVALGVGSLLLRRPGCLFFCAVAFRLAAESDPDPSDEDGQARATVGVLASCLLVAALLSGCGSSRHATTGSSLPADLVAQSRPIGRAPAFHPPATGPVLGDCRGQLGARRGVHVELFAANRVVLIASGIGTRGPRQFSSGRISSARCYGDLVTLEPTGVVLVRRDSALTLSDLFRSWGQPLSSTRLASFSARAGERVDGFVDGRPWHGPPGRVPLRPHAEIVLEVGPHVPPHRSYTFPPGA